MMEQGKNNIGQSMAVILILALLLACSAAESFAASEPSAVNISKVTCGVKAFTVKWKKPSTKKLSGITGYQIRYSTDKTFKTGVKIRSIGKSKTSVKVTKLHALAEYYVQLRTYVKIDGKKQYSAWSPARKVMTKVSCNTKFETDIKKIENRYGKKKPQGKVIFYGSSSIRKWTTLSKDMSKLSVLNHGFGGSKVPDCLYYADRMIIPFNPEAIVFYAGTNDIGKGASVNATYAYTIDFINYIHRKLPDTPIFYLAQTQQPKRVKYWKSMQKLNRKVKAYAAKDPLVIYIDTESTLNNSKGKARSSYFVSDGLHFTAKGYRAWTSVIRPVLYAELIDSKTAADTAPAETKAE